MMTQTKANIDSGTQSGDRLKRHKMCPTVKNTVQDSDRKESAVNFFKIRNIVKFVWKCKFFLLFKQTPLSKLWKRNILKQGTDQEDGVGSSRKHRPPFKRGLAFDAEQQRMGE